jgi:uroporphyrinogen-III synthase
MTGPRRGPAPPLEGVRVAVTRAVHQHEEMAAALAAHGAVVLVRPLIRIDPPARPDLLADAASRISVYSWVVFTSANAVDRFISALERAGSGARGLASARVAAVGPATATALRKNGVRVDLSPPDSSGEALATMLAAQTELRGTRVLWPKASGAAPAFARALEDAGARVDAIDAYQTFPDYAAGAALRGETEQGLVDVLTFASPSAVAAYAGDRVSGCRARVAVIGPVTAKAARARGLTVDIEPAGHTAADLVRAIVEHFAENAGNPDQAGSAASEVESNWN